jgi:hypothetical protein
LTSRASLGLGMGLEKKTKNKIQIKNSKTQKTQTQISHFLGLNKLKFVFKIDLNKLRQALNKF